MFTVKIKHQNDINDGEWQVFLLLTYIIVDFEQVNVCWEFLWKFRPSKAVELSTTFLRMSMYNVLPLRSSEDGSQEKYTGKTYLFKVNDRNTRKS